MEEVVLTVVAIKIGDDTGVEENARCSIHLHVSEDVPFKTADGTTTTISLTKAYATVYVSEEVALATKRGTKFRLVQV